MLKAVILLGGPQKGTRFRPLSLDIPKPLFAVAGLPLIQHHIEACTALENLKEILLIGYYPVAEFQQFVTDMQHMYNVNIRYLQEFAALGTGGGLFHFRDQIRCGNPKAFFVMNGDICADFPLQKLYEFHQLKSAVISIVGTEATRQQSLNYGCMATDKVTQEVMHYVEKPNSYVSTLISCGIYMFSLDIFQTLSEAFNSKHEDYYKVGNGNKNLGYIQLEREILSPLAGTGKMYALEVNTWWSQLKTAAAAIYANRHYLELYQIKHPERLYQSVDSSGDAIKTTCTIIPNVYVHPSAKVHPTAVLGPNVSIGPGVHIGPGARIQESIILADAVIENHSLVLYCIVGHNSRIGWWARIEGTPTDPDPNKPFAKMENLPLFNQEGKLNPSITILGCHVTVPPETMVLNSLVLPHKELARNFKNEIIL